MLCLLIAPGRHSTGMYFVCSLHLKNTAQVIALLAHCTWQTQHRHVLCFLTVPGEHSTAQCLACLLAVCLSGFPWPLSIQATSIPLPRPGGKVSASKAADPDSIPTFPLGHLPRRVIPLTNVGLTGGYPARPSDVIGSALGLVDPCRYTVTGLDSKFDLQLLSQCGSTYI